MDCIVHQAPLSVGFSRREYLSGLCLLFQGIFPDAEIKPAPPVSPALASRFCTTSTTWEVPSWISMALNPVDAVLRKERGIRNTQKERSPQGGDRGWNDASAQQATSGIADRHEKPGEACVGFGFRASEDTNHADTLISDFWLPELWGNKFLLFQASMLWKFITTAALGN